MSERKSQIIEWAFILIVVAYTVFLLLTSEADAQNWSPKAAHHQSVVAIRVEAGNELSYGSGVYIQFGNRRGILTCRHLFDCSQQGCKVKSINIKWQDATVTKSLQWTSDKFGHDLTFVFAENPKYKPATVAPANITPGQVVEFASYGGPQEMRLGQHQIRHYFASTKTTTPNRTTFDAVIMEQDSGGPVLTKDTHRVVGIQIEGENLKGQSQGRKVYRGAVAVSLPVIQAFLTRVYKTYKPTGYGYQRYDCPTCPPSPGVVQPGIQFFPRNNVQIQQAPLPEIDPNLLFPPDLPTAPPTAPQQPTPVAQPETPPVQIPACDCDLKPLLAQIQQLQQQIAILQNQPPPDPLPAPNPGVSQEQYQTLQAELSRLKTLLETLANRPTQVDLLNAEGKVIQSKTYPAGRPIRLQGVYRPATQGK